MKWQDHRAGLTLELAARPGGDALASLLSALFAPPNLRYLRVILQRAELLAGAGQTWDHLSYPLGGVSHLKDALGWIDAPATAIESSLRDEWHEIPGGDGRARNSPLNRYCVSEFPIWSALLVETTAADASLFNDLCSHVLGDMIGESRKLATDAAYRDFLQTWQERRNTSGRSNIVRPNHPYGSRLSTICAIEQTLRALSLPEHNPSWKLLEESGATADVLLGDPFLFPGLQEPTYKCLFYLSSLLDRLDLEPTRGGRRFNGLLRSAHLHKIGRGCFVYQLGWIYQSAETSEEESGLTLVSEIDRKSVVGRLTQDYALEELARPSGIATYSASDEEANLLAPALVVRTKWHYQMAQSVNQLPRWTLKTLTGQQLANFLHAIFNPAIDYAKDTREILLARILQSASFATGLNRNSVLENLVLDDSTRATISSRIEYRVRDRHFRIAANLPDLVTGDDQGVRARKIEKFVCVPDRIGFHFLAEEWLRRHGGERSRIAGSEGDSPRLSLPPTALDHEIEAMNIRPAQIAQALPRAVLDQTGDIASIALWGDWEPVHTRTIRHYLSPMSDGIEKSIDQALLRLIRRAKLSYGSGMSSRDLMRRADDIPAKPSPRRIGSPNFPTLQDVQDLCAFYQEKLARDPGGSMPAIIAYSNAYTAYTAFHMSAALAYRAAIDPGQEFLCIDGRTVALFSDKDSKGFHRRVIPVPGCFDEHRRHYINHRRMMESLLPGLKGKFDSLLFWIDGETPKRFEPLRAERDARPLWRYRINALRRRMRTRLYERGAPGAPTDVWMGHWNLGACPWMQGSGFEIGELWNLVETHVEPILEEDGWAAIRSSLVEGLAWAS